MHTDVHTQSSSANSGRGCHREQARGLGVLAAVVLVVVPQAPLGSLTFGMATNFAATGAPAFPLMFALVGVVLLAFALAASAMARQVSHPGGLYAYVSHGLGRRAGLGAALIGLIGYSAMTVTFFVPIGDQGSQLLAARTGVTVPWWLLVTPAVLLVGLLGTRSTAVVVRVLGVLLAAQLVLIAVFDVAALAQPGPEGVSTAALNPASLLNGGVSAALAFVLVAFVGAETVASYTGELRRTRPSVSRVAYLGVGLMAVVYAFTCWALTVATGPEQVIDQSRALGIRLVPTLVDARLGSAAGTLFRSLVLVSIFAAALAFHNVAARYLRALARDGVFPRQLASRDARTGAPVAGSIVQTGVSLTLVLITGVSGANPFATLFPWLSDIGGLGVVLLLILVSISVVAFFLRTDSEESGFLGWEGPVVAGFFATVTLTVLVVLALIQFDVRLGVPRDSPLGYLPPLLLVVVFLGGIIWASVLRASRPDVFSQIGRTPPGAAANPARSLERPRATLPDRHLSQ